MLPQQRCSASDSPHFSLGSVAWRAGALCREMAALVSARQRCSSPTVPRTAQDGPLRGWPTSRMAHFRDGPPQPLPAASAKAGCKAHGDAVRAPSDRSLGGEGWMLYSKLENFMASLGNGYQFQGPSQGENAPISCGFWQEDKFHNSSSQEA